jgi:thiol-disulfide isomerase/thioredoxin
MTQKKNVCQIYRMKKIVAKAPAFKKGTSDVVRYMLIGALVLLVAFTLVYVYNIHTMSSKLEKFTNSGVVKPHLKIVYLKMDGCGHCREFSVTFQSIRQSLIANGDINQKYTLDIQELESKDAAAQQYINDSSADIKGFPTVLVYVDGKYKRKIVGNNSEAEVLTAITDAARTL